MPGRMRDIGWVYFCAAVGLSLVAISIFGNILGSFSDAQEFDKFTLDHYNELFHERDLLEVLGRTLLLGVGTVFWLVVFAFPFTWVLTRTNFRWKTGLFTLLTAKLAIPGFITAMAYVWLFNPNSGLINKMFGMTVHTGEPLFDVYQLGYVCFLQGIVLVPGGIFMMIPAFRNLDASLEEASWVSGVTKSETIWKIVLPLLAPGMCAVGIFFFVVGVEMFDFVAIIGMPGDVLVLWIYDALNDEAGEPKIGYAAAVGVLMFAICGSAILFYVRFLKEAKKYATVGGKGRSSGVQPLGKWRLPAYGWIGVWVTASVGLPVVTLIWVSLVPYFQPPSMRALGSMTLTSYFDAMEWIGEPLQNTLIVMAGAIIIAATLASSITWVVTRSQHQSARWADTIVFLAPAVPTIVTATAFQYVGVMVYQWLPLYGTIWLIAIAMGTRMLAYCTRTMNSTALQIQFELDEASYVSGVSKLTTFRSIFLPLMAPAIFYSALMVGLLAARDLTLPLVMNTGKQQVVSVLIFDLQTNGDQNAAAAVSLYMIVVLVLLALFARRMTGMQETGVHRQRRRRKFFALPRLNGRRTTTNLAR
ncbi:MAG: ABC transporter permease subunit [Pseudomonadota bacterium]|nr:ABC transporter permease subunit [Pseudomonadota bacterium]